MARNQFAVDHDACGVGFVTQLGRRGSHEIVERALEALRRLAHRGGVDADGRSGDGAGLLTQIPDSFIRKQAWQDGIDLPAVFGLGVVFLPSGNEVSARAAIQSIAIENGVHCLGWRVVPTKVDVVGPRALDTLPVIEQCFFATEHATDSLELLLFRLRKQVERYAPSGTYVCSLSSRTVVYKGLLTPEQLPGFYPDLGHSEFESSFAIFHQRYSTNTQPSWSLAQPFRLVAHNGEINTISANRRWLHAKEAALRKELRLSDEDRLRELGVSDSASFDNAFELYLRRGYSATESMLAMVPPAWENAPALSPELHAFLEQHARTQEPWDGPAALIFTDGEIVGAKLDRNGLRPLRYTLTSDGLLVAGSEVGIADLSGKRVIERQRLGPGEMLIANPATGELIRPNESLLIRRVERKPAVIIGPREPSDASSQEPETKQRMAALGWTEDQFRLLFRPLVEQGYEAVWSMGDDAALASLSKLRRPLWDYCKQRFAQVTNPPIDSMRESHVMSLRLSLGDSVVLPSPVIDTSQLKALQQHFRSITSIEFTFPVCEGVEGAQAAVRRIQEQATEAAAKNRGLVLLTDRGVDASHAAVPALLAVAAVWKSLVQAGACEIPLVIETGQVVDTHHLALLVAAGASAVLPYLALQQASLLAAAGATRYRVAVEKGLRKVIARMGISNIASYRNSQLFETLGLDAEICDEFFEDAGRALGGKSLREILQDCVDRHCEAFAEKTTVLRDVGLYRFRHNGEQHANSPELVRRMHRYIKSPTDENYKAFSELGEQRTPIAIRDQLEVVPGTPIPLNEVESDASVLSRFSTQAMSLGAVSPETHRTLAAAMNRLGARSNTGEGGEDRDVYGESSEANNRVKQVASARFGVTAEYLVHADELEIKIAQGAKPGEGGQLPASKVSAYVARLRHATPNMTLISPPPHHDIYSIEDLAQLIYDLRAVNPRARIGVKLVASTGVGIIAAGVAKAGADVITISGHDGGTGASPLSSIKNTGLPWEVGLRETHIALIKAGLRGRVRLRVDGGFKFARDVIVAALLGADEFGFGTAALLSIGCVMARQCHLNTCPAGIATQDEKLRARFAGKPEMVESYFRALAQEVRERLASMGAQSIADIVGRADFLKPRNSEAKPALADLLDLVPTPQQKGFLIDQDTSLHLELTRTLNHPLVSRQHFQISSADRSIGAHLSGEILRRSDASIGSKSYEFLGSAGQSFGAFLVPGLNFHLNGEANDYIGKSLSGGTISISGGDEASRRGDVLAGNTVLYGATSGELYIAGRVGERFAVRNSGAFAVVEGAGLHACEYMTAGVVVILGPTGMNLGAGMTGGLAYLLRESIGGHGYNQESVRLAPLEVREEIWLRRVLLKHLRLTNSPRAGALLSTSLPLPFLRVEPIVPPCGVAETWSATLARTRAKKMPVPMLEVPVHSQTTAVM
jgi:glutamate synthase (ferredoxin)